MESAAPVTEEPNEWDEIIARLESTPAKARRYPNSIQVRLLCRLDEGEGFVSKSGKDELQELLETPSIAVDVLDDWIAELTFWKTMAHFAMEGAEHAREYDEGRRPLPTVEDLKEMFDRFGQPYAEEILADEYLEFFDECEEILDAWTDYWTRSSAEERAAKVIQFPTKEA